MKKCPRCEKTKPLSEFYKNKARADGTSLYCRACSAEYVRRWTTENSKRHKENRRRWRAANLEKYRQSTRRWQTENLEKRRKYAHYYYVANREKCKEATRRWQADNPKIFRESKRRWRVENPVTPTYVTWHKMLQRCRDFKAQNYKYYGGRGITVCNRWDNQKGGSFSNFLADMGERPEDRTIDRINPDGNYEPNNCRWATRVEQGINRRNSQIKAVLF